MIIINIKHGHTKQYSFAMDANTAHEELIISDDLEDPAPPPPPPKKNCAVPFAVACCMVFVAGVAFNRGGAHAKSHSGITPSMAHMTLDVNTSADPCTNPWQFFCGGYIHRHADRRGALATFQMQIRESLTRALENDDTSSLMARVYRKCVSDPDPYVQKNITAMFLWQRGYTAKRLQFGRVVDGDKLDYAVQIDNDQIPYIIESNTESACSAQLLQIAAEVFYIDPPLRIIMYGEQDDVLCDALANRLNWNPLQWTVTYTPAVCFDYVAQLWPGRLSQMFLESNSEKVTHMSETIQTLFAEIQSTFVDRLRKASYNGLANKIESVTIETTFQMPLEMYDEINDGASIDDTFADLLRSQFEQEVHTTSLVNNMWDMRADVVNAYYNPLSNDMHITPAMLLYTAESRDTPALLYGRLGFVIAHEMAHAIDPSGIEYDKHGNRNRGSVLENENVNAYRGGVKCIESEFSTKGRTTGEDVADHIAIAVMKTVMQKLPSTAPLQLCSPQCVSFSSMAQFYTYFAQTWCSGNDNVDEEDVHSPGKVRVEHALSSANANSAFDCIDKTRAPNQCTLAGF